MKAVQFREMSPDELRGKLDELERRTYDLRCQAVTETMENSKARRNIRRDIARINTIIREKQLAVKTE